MRTTLLFTAAMAACASAAHAADTITLQAQPLAAAPGEQIAAKPAVAGKAVTSPKLTAAIATRNSDGTLEVGCIEKPNPRAARAPIKTISPEPQQ
ncbi:MAG: hypothetical protein JSS42_00375 [Proteobacteria bacterium]|nr:hypothetical protein [Pseudomonadota bacterium]